MRLPTGAKLTVEIGDGANLELDLNDGNAKLKLGDGVVSVAIGDNLQTFYTSGVKGKYGVHKHATGTGPSGPPDTPLDDYNTAINSTHMTVPDEP